MSINLLNTQKGKISSSKKLVAVYELQGELDKEKDIIIVNPDEKIESNITKEEARQIQLNFESDFRTHDD